MGGNVEMSFPVIISFAYFFHEVYVTCYIYTLVYAILDDSNAISVEAR